MPEASTNLLLVGESDVGKTHYGAQLLRRLNTKSGALRFREAPKSITTFEAAVNQLSRGLSSGHTPHSVYEESIWPLQSSDGVAANLVWPDYGGEQIAAIIDSLRLSVDWQKRITDGSGWILMVRPSRITIEDDALTRSLANPTNPDSARNGLTAQSRLIELMQVLQFVSSASYNHNGEIPPLLILLSCYDELDIDELPSKIFSDHMPMLDQYVRSIWTESGYRLFGLSALGRALNDIKPDEEYINSGPNKFGFVVDEDGNQSEDLTLPLEWLIKASAIS